MTWPEFRRRAEEIVFWLLLVVILVVVVALVLVVADFLLSHLYFFMFVLAALLGIGALVLTQIVTSKWAAVKRKREALRPQREAQRARVMRNREVVKRNRELAREKRAELKASLNFANQNLAGADLSRRYRREKLENLEPHHDNVDNWLYEEIAFHERSASQFEWEEEIILKFGKLD